jgi:glucose-6-phosphate isomerase
MRSEWSATTGSAIRPGKRELRAEIEQTNKRIKRIAADIHAGKIAAENGKRFEYVLLIGIGGSARGPELVADALGSAHDPMDIYFFDNTDPDGFDRVFDKIDPPKDGLAVANNRVSQTLVVVVSKSGGTKETRNGMLEAEANSNRRNFTSATHCGRDGRRK